MKIILPGKPIPKARARHANRGSYTITYDPQGKEKSVIKQEVALQLNQAINSLDRNIFTEASNICLGKVFTVSFNFYLPINASDTIAERNAKLWGLQPHVSKPDYDNLEKFYLDCINGIIWSDDSLIVDGEAHKHYSDEPRVEIEVKVKQLPKLSESEKKVLTFFSPKEMKELFIDASHLSFMGTVVPFDQIHEIKEHSLRCVALELNKFAIKYASVLKKIEKLGDINKQRQDVNNLIEEIEEGKHAV